MGSFKASPSPIVLTDLQVDGTTVVVDATNNRLGVGVAEPSAKLEVAGNISGSGGLDMVGAVTFENTLNVSGSAVFAGEISGSGVLNIVGATTLESTLNLSGAFTTPSYFDIAEMSAPANPAANVGRLYVADDGGTTTLYFKDAAGTATSCIQSGGGGAVSAVANGANNRVATFSSGDALNGESSMTFDGSVLKVTGEISGSGDLNIVGAATLESTLSVTGAIGTAAGVSASLGVSSSYANFNSLSINDAGTNNLTITGDGKLATTGEISGSGVLNIVGAATLESTLNVTGAVSTAAGVSASLGVSSSYANFNSLSINDAGTNSLSITGDGKLATTGEISGSGPLNIVGAATLESTLYVTGNVGIGTADPGTMLQIEGASAYLTLKNITAENGEGGAETRIIFEDHSNAALAQIQASHDGTADDTKGDLIFSTNNGSGLVEAFRVASNKHVTFAGETTFAGPINFDQFSDDILFASANNAFSYNEWKASSTSGVTVKNTSTATGGKITLASGAGIVNFQSGTTDFVTFTGANSGDCTVNIATNSKDLIFTQFDGHEVARVHDNGGLSSRKRVAGIDDALDLSSVANAVPYSGAIIAIDQDAAYAVTLPTATSTAEAAKILGWHVRIIVVDAGSNDVTVVRGDASNDFLMGTVASAAGDSNAAAGITVSGHTVTFANGVSAVGDFVDITCVSATDSNTVFTVSGLAST
jgi:fibronectin-binding autotransporter adhesin